MKKCKIYQLIITLTIKFIIFQKLSFKTSAKNYLNNLRVQRTS